MRAAADFLLNHRERLIIGLSVALIAMLGIVLSYMSLTSVVEAFQNLG